MIPLLPNPFNPEDTEFVLDADSFMAALSQSDPADEANIAGPARPRFLQRERARLGQLRRPEPEAAAEPDGTSHRRFAPDIAGRRLDTPVPPPLRDEEELFYLAGANPERFLSDIAQDHTKKR